MQARMEIRQYRIERLAAHGAMALGFDEDDIRDCVLSLTPDDFHKSMESRSRPGSWQDVYKPVYEEVGVYLKLQMGAPSDTIVIQFKRDESYDR